MNLPSALKRYTALIVVLVLAVLITVAYVEGYRAGPGITISRIGTLTLQNLPKGTTIYIDGESSGTAAATSSALHFNLTPGNHMVIVSAQNDFPWSNLISIASGKSTDIAPVFVPMNIHVSPLTGAAAKSALAAIASTTLPTQAHPLLLENGCADVYVSNNQVIATAATSTPDCGTPPAFLCTNGSCDPTVIFSPAAQLTTVLPYPGHVDALVVGINDTLYALALDPRSPQFFAPILQGAGVPTAAISSSTLVVSIGGGTIFSVPL